MPTRDEAIEIRIDGQMIAGTMVAPTRAMPGILFVHGWGGSQEHYIARAREIAALGCVCLTVDLRGHGATEHQHPSVTREENLRDVLAAYDMLSRGSGVDRNAIGIVGSSYGGYLAAIVTSMREVRWLALRVPALYKEEDWGLPKVELKKYGLDAFRRGPVSPKDNRALAAASEFVGDVLLVESEHDDIIPHPVVSNYVAAFSKAHSLTYRVIAGADHQLSAPAWQQAYTSLLVNWATEMVLGVREEGTAAAVHTRTSPSPQRGPATPA